MFKILVFIDYIMTIPTLLRQDYGSGKVGLLPKGKEVKRKEIEKKRIEIKEIYNSTCTNLPQIQKLTDKRNKAIDKFLKEFTKEQFEQICQIANSSNFLKGENDRHWKADFDFLMRIDKATNVLEGKYNNKTGGIDDFKELWEEAKQENEQTGNNTNNNTFSW